MKKTCISLLFMISIIFFTPSVFSQTVTDIDGNSYDFLTYGNQVWTVENAEMERYQDGTPIPQVSDAAKWENLTTGAWCYYNFDPSKGKLYNWYAVMGIHDNDKNTPNKLLAPKGWHLPSLIEWETLQNHLIADGNNYDGTTTNNKIAKAMASTNEWISSSNVGSPGNAQSANNGSGFNALPTGWRSSTCDFRYGGKEADFWTTTELDNYPKNANQIQLFYNDNNVWNSNGRKNEGASVRFIKD